MPFEGPYDPADDRVRCDDCDGMGWRQGSTVFPAYGGDEDDDCQVCGGRGWVREDALEEEDLAEDGE